MLVSCINCNSQTDLPEIIDENEEYAYCSVCKFPIIGINYIECPNCKHKILSIFNKCSFCNHNFNEDTKTDTKELSAYKYLDDINYELINTNNRVLPSIEEINTTKFTELAVDTETTGLNPYYSNVLLIQIATPEKVYIYDCTKLKDLSPVKKILEEEKYLKILQNAKFDFKMLKHHYKIEMNNIFDTMLAERILTAGISREISLKAITGKYLNRYMDKSVRSSFVNSNGNFTETQLKYAAEDVIVLHPIYKIQKIQLEKHNLTQIGELEFKTLVAVGDMELNGVKLDKEKWRKLIVEAGKNKDKVEKELLAILTKNKASEEQQSLFDNMHSINLNSSMQLLKAFKKIGIDLPDTSNKTLKEHGEKEAIKCLLEYRKYEKLITSFGDNMLQLINDKTGRIHPDFYQFGADTGRFSCQNPNVQQIPSSHEFRECFIAENGYKLITGDYSQAELRILADLSKDEGFIKAFRSGGDLHKLTASQMFNVPVEEVSKKMRSAAKTINFGLAYGMGMNNLAIQLEISKQEAKKLIDNYFKAYSGVKKWLEKAAKEAFQLGYSITPSGRKRFYEKPRSTDKNYNSKKASIERQGKNTPIQGANADITKYALVFLYKSLKSYNAKLVNTVHDEIVVEAPEDKVKEVKELLEKEMVRAGKEVVKLVPMIVEAEIADYWTK